MKKYIVVSNILIFLFFVPFYSFLLNNFLFSILFLPFYICYLITYFVFFLLGLINSRVEFFNKFIGIINILINIFSILGVSFLESSLQELDNPSPLFFLVKILFIINVFLYYKDRFYKKREEKDSNKTILEEYSKKEKAKILLMSLVSFMVDFLKNSFYLLILFLYSSIGINIGGILFINSEDPMGIVIGAVFLFWFFIFYFLFSFLEKIQQKQEIGVQKFYSKLENKLFLGSFLVLILSYFSSFFSFLSVGIFIIIAFGSILFWLSVIFKIIRIFKEK